MLAITCDKCRRRYTATDEELRVYLNEAEGKKYAQVLCPLPKYSLNKAAYGSFSTSKGPAFP